MLFETSRLIIRPMQEADATAVLAYRSLTEVARYQGWTPTDCDEIAAHAQQMRGQAFNKRNLWFQLILLLKSGEQQGSIIGDMAYALDEETGQQAELGVALAPTLQGRGLAKEALAGLCNWLFEHLELHRLHVCIDPANAGSIRLFERLGFRHEGLLKKAVWFKGEWADDLIMAVLSEEWPQCYRG